MKKYTYIILIIFTFFFSCKKETTLNTNETTKNNLKPIQKEEYQAPYKTWIKLTNKNSKEIIFNPCDADNKKLIVTKKIIKEYVGHEVLTHRIKSIENEGNKYNFILENNGVFTFKYLSLKKGVWASKDTYFNGDFTAIDSLYSNEIEIVNQPCIECWEKEDCDEMEKNKKNR